MDKIQTQITSDTLEGDMHTGLVSIVRSTQLQVSRQKQPDKWIKDISKQFAEEEIISMSKEHSRSCSCTLLIREQTH